MVSSEKVHVRNVFSAKLVYAFFFVCLIFFFFFLFCCGGVSVCFLMKKKEIKNITDFCFG